MTFGLPSWLKSRYKDLLYEVPVWYPSRDQPDNREWLITNGLGGYSSSTISDAHTRRYHGLLVAALRQPVGRHIILSRVQEQLSLDGVEYDLSTNHWASGVVAPTGYRYIESFTTYPAPTWIYNINGNYLIKQIVLEHNVNEVYIGYHWLPDRDRSSGEATLVVRFLTGFRDFHKEVAGSSDKSYNQSISGNRTEIKLEESLRTLQLTWDGGVYEPQSQWWWEYHWPEEAARDMPDREDLFLVGQLTTELAPGKELNICASLDRAVDSPSCHPVVEANLLRQNKLIQTAALPRSQETNLLILACYQFLVARQTPNSHGTSVIAGYPWFNDAGRAAMISLPGLAVSTRQFDRAKQTLALYSELVEAGIMANRFTDESDKPEFVAVDPTLWWAWALYHFYRATKDQDFTRAQLISLKQAALHYLAGTAGNIKVDPTDGLIRCGTADLEVTWMDAQVADIPITPRSGKPVEISALWHNLLGTICYLSEELAEDPDQFKALFAMTEKSMQKFWNDSKQCLFDVIEPLYRSSDKPDDTVRPNQLLAISLPFRAFTKLQEKSILALVDSELLTPVGVRSLSPTDPSYQSRYGCGFSRADQYHRDLSYHQGSVWPWLIGAYCDALMNVHGPLPETNAKIRILLQPLLNNLVEESCVGSISEIFDGNAPHMPHGCFAHSMAVAEVMRTLSRVLRS